jgi:CubicO group peptidase (beta-lactamase class C family)
VSARARTARLPRAGLVALALIAACATGCTSQPEPLEPTVVGALDRVLEVGLEELGVPGVTAAIEMGGRRWHGAAGVADRSTGRRATVDTPFRLASITKTYLAALTLQLAEDDQLALDDHVGLAGVPAEATVRQLLNHTSGLPHDDGGTPPWSADELAAVDRMACAPGTCVEYSDLNSIALGLVIERQTRAPLAEVLRAFLDERDLVHTWFSDDGGVPQGTAVQHDDTGAVEGSAFDASWGPRTWAAGAMVATVDDLLTWTRDVVAGDVLSHPAREEMLDVVPTLDLPCPRHCIGRYGLGVASIRLQGRAAFGHGGSTGTFAFHVPSDDLTIAVLTNRLDGGGAARVLATRLAAAAGLDEHADVWTVRVDGTGLRRLTDTDGVDGGPAWSPDGDRIVFGSTRDGQPELYIMDADGSDERRLTRDLAVDGAGRFSPDGSRIAFASDRRGNLDIWTMASDGSDPRRLTSSPLDERLPSFSSDGRIAFETGPEGERDLAVMDGDGSDLLLMQREGDQFHASWAPDGSRLAYQEGGDGIWTVRPDGSDPAPIPGTGPYDRFPSWGPTGAITFNTPHGDLWLTDPDGSSRRRLMLTVEEEFGAWWSPDGTHLVFPSDRP